MVDKKEISKCLINSQNENLIITFTDGTNTLIPISNQSNHLQDIYHANNNVYRQFMFEGANVPEQFRDGCLPSIFLGIDDCPAVNINLRYLINSYLSHMDIIFGCDGNRYLFQRDQNYDIPISEAGLRELYSEMISGLNEPVNGQPQHEQVEEEEQSIQLLLKVVLQYIIHMLPDENDISHKYEKKINKMKRKTNVCGGVSNVNNMIDQIKNIQFSMNDIKSNMSKSVESIKTFLLQNKLEIARIIQNDEKTNAIKRVNAIITNIDSQIPPLYILSEITPELMFQAIGDIFSVAFECLIPKTSFTLALHASFYNSAFLYKMNLLDRYKNVLFLPVIYRLTHSCFKDDTISSERVEVAMKNMEAYCPRIISDIHRLSNPLATDDARCDVICGMGARVTATDESMLNALYILMNEIRGYTIELYLILLVSVFLQTPKYAAMNTENKKMNAKNFISPLYTIICLFQKFIEGAGKELVFCSSTIESFNKIYGSEMKKVIAEFSRKMFSQAAAIP